MPTLEEQYQALNEYLNAQQPVLPPAMPRGSPDDGTSPGLLGRIGSVLAGGQSPIYRLRGREEDAAGNRALLNFGLNMLQASGPARVRPDLLSAAATGLQGAQQSMDLIECQNPCGWIVDRFRQCLDSDVDDHPEGKRRILLHGAFRAEGGLGSQRAIAERRGAAVQAEQWFRRGHEIADPRHEVDYSVCIAS